MHPYCFRLRPVPRSNAATVTAAALLWCASCSLGTAGTFVEETSFGSNPGHLKMFTYAPDRLPDPAPLVVVLHGCNQSASGTLDHSGWREEADAGGFALLLPEQRIGPGPVFFSSGLNHPTRCFNFAEVRDSTRDSGEAQSIRQMIDRMTDVFGIDPTQIFVTGLSAGGGMTSAMLATYPDVFAGGAIIAGLPYRCGNATRTADVDCGVTLSFGPHRSAPDETPQEWGRRVRAAAPGFAGPWPRVSIWQGGADGTVDPPNADELVEQWTDVHGVDAVPDAEGAVGPARRVAFADAEGGVKVESYAIAGFGHATPIDPDGAARACGRAGEPFILDADICSTHAIAEFFRLVGVAPSVAIIEAVVDGDAITVTGSADDPGGAVTEVSVRLDGPEPPLTLTATGGAAWSARFEGLPGDAFYLPVATAVDGDGLVATARGEPVAVGSPPANAPPVIEIGQVLVERDCVTVDGRAADPDSRIRAVAVRLGSRSPSPAALNEERFEFAECGLPDGVYATEVSATDALDAETSAQGPIAEIATRESASGTWLEHMSAGRLRIYHAPCASVGFGSCDAAFPAIHAERGFSDFELFRGASSEDWFVNPGNIP